MNNYNYYFNSGESELTFNSEAELNSLIDELQKQYSDKSFEVRTWETSEDLELGEFDVIYEGTSLKESVSIAMDAVDCDKAVHAEVYTDCDDFLFCAKYESDEELEYF